MANTDSVNASDLNRRITIQSPITADNGMGGTDVTGWNDLYTCSANMQNFPHGRGLFRNFLFAQLYPQVTTTIQIRWQRSVQIDATMRVKYTAHGIDHYYQILGVENPVEANTSIWLLCKEQQAKAVN